MMTGKGCLGLSGEGWATVSVPIPHFQGLMELTHSFLATLVRSQTFQGQLSLVDRTLDLGGGWNAEGWTCLTFPLLLTP